MNFEVPALYKSEMGLTCVPIPLAPLLNKTLLTRGIVREIWEWERHGNERDKEMKEKKGLLLLTAYVCMTLSLLSSEVWVKRVKVKIG